MVRLYETASLFSMGQCQAVRYLWTPPPTYSFPLKQSPPKHYQFVEHSACWVLLGTQIQCTVWYLHNLSQETCLIFIVSIDCTGLTETQQNAFIWLMYIPSLMLHCDVNNVLFLPYSNLIDSQAFWVLKRAIVVVNAVTIGFHIGWGLRKVQCPFSDIEPRIVYWSRVG